MQFLKHSQRPKDVLEALATPGQPAIYRMHIPGFGHHMNRMPVIDARQEDQSEAIDLTRIVLAEMFDDVARNLGTMGLPKIEDDKFGRIILAVEDPVHGPSNELIGKSEIVLALWGKGFMSPCHGHAPGYINEALMTGAFDVNLYREFGDPRARMARLFKTIEQRESGIFYEEYVRDTGKNPRSAVIHNFQATEYSTSLHYLPEHVRNGADNRFTPVMGEVREFELKDSEVSRVNPETVMKSEVGDVYLVRSNNVPDLGDHYIVITGGLIEKPHGKRPDDIVFSIAEGETTPLDSYAGEPLVLLKLNDKRVHAFYDHCSVNQRYRK